MFILMRPDEISCLPVGDKAVMFCWTVQTLMESALSSSNNMIFNKTDSDLPPGVASRKQYKLVKDKVLAPSQGSD